MEEILSFRRWVLGGQSANRSVARGGQDAQPLTCHLCMRESIYLEVSDRGREQPAKPLIEPESIAFFQFRMDAGETFSNHFGDRAHRLLIK